MKEEKAEHRKFHANTRKSLLTVRAWDGCPGAVDCSAVRAWDGCLPMRPAAELLWQGLGSASPEVPCSSMFLWVLSYPVKSLIFVRQLQEHCRDTAVTPAHSARFAQLLQDKSLLPGGSCSVCGCQATSCLKDNRNTNRRNRAACSLDVLDAPDSDCVSSQLKQIQVPFCSLCWA